MVSYKRGTHFLNKNMVSYKRGTILEKVWFQSGFLYMFLHACSHVLCQVRNFFSSRRYEDCKITSVAVLQVDSQGQKLS